MFRMSDTTTSLFKSTETPKREKLRREKPCVHTKIIGKRVVWRLTNTDALITNTFCMGASRSFVSATIAFVKRF